MLTYPDLKPETVNSYEIGYRGLFTKKLLVDAYVYYKRVQRFYCQGSCRQGRIMQAPIPLTEFTELSKSFYNE